MIFALLLRQKRHFVTVFLPAILSIVPTAGAFSQAAPAAQKLQFVLILSRHGVRSPTAAGARLGPNSLKPWPEWQVPPGNLTAHGYQLMAQFGAYDRMWLTAAGVLPKSNCANRLVYIYADSDQRTIVSGQALAEGLSAGCGLQVHSLPLGRNDSLFHLPASYIGDAARDQAFNAIQSRLHGDPGLPTAANRAQLEKLQSVLNGCDPDSGCPPGKPKAARQLLAIPAALAKGDGDHLFDLRGPLPMGSTFAEDLQLEYANGFPISSVGWGLLDEGHIRGLLQLHSAYFDLVHRIPFVAQVEASNLLEHILCTLDQAVSGRPVPGAVGHPGDKVVILVGHDTNLAAIAALLHLAWTADGRADDTPPGAELQFLVFTDRSGRASIQLRYAVQTLRQMRDATPLSPRNPPAKVTLNVPACTSAGSLCTWQKFHTIAASAVDQLFVVSPPASSEMLHIPGALLLESMEERATAAPRHELKAPVGGYRAKTW